MNPPIVRAGVPVEFLIGSRDVNHGFGLYDPSGTLLTQVQVVPGATQKLVWTFDEAGHATRSSASSSAVRSTTR